jgi:hypothetical protein
LTGDIGREGTEAGFSKQFSVVDSQEDFRAFHAILERSVRAHFEAVGCTIAGPKAGTGVTLKHEKVRMSYVDRAGWYVASHGLGSVYTGSEES